MRILKRIYNFLGGITFAIILLTVTAMVIIVGTVIESATDSHLYAESLTYSHPLFSLLLWGFFINILVSALRRWPFRWKHIPFLITHFGLLMIIGGCIIKNSYGVQGNMRLIEGSGDHRIFLSNTHSLLVERRDSQHPEKIHSKQYLLPENSTTGSLTADSSFPELDLKLVNLIPNASEQWDSWLKGDHLQINGFPPFRITDIDSFDAINVLPSPHTLPIGKESWRLYALRTSSVAEAIERILRQNLSIVLKNRLTEETLATTPLDEAVSGEQKLAATLSIPEEEDLPVTLEFATQLAKGALALNGSHALENRPSNKAAPSDKPLYFSLSGSPILAFIEDENKEVTFLVVSECGAIQMKQLPREKESSLLVYDEGFGGYSTYLPLPCEAWSFSFRDLEKLRIYHLATALREALAKEKQLAPPLALLNAACKKADIDFVETLILFLDTWHRSERWVITDDIQLPKSVYSALSNIDWRSVDAGTVKAGLWACYLLEQIQEEVMQGRDILEVLRDKQWPLLSRLEDLREQSAPIQENEYILLTDALIHQVFLIGDQLPDIPLPEVFSSKLSATMLSILFRSHSIGFKEILPPVNEESLAESKDRFLRASLLFEELHNAFPPLRTMHLNQKVAFVNKLPAGHSFLNTFSEVLERYFPGVTGSVPTHFFTAILPTIPLDFGVYDLSRISERLGQQPVTLESMIIPRYVREEPKNKLEDNIPLAVIEASDERSSQKVPLPYDPYGTGFKWPLLYGEYRTRFQPETMEIPYHLRLRNARQVNYANSSQPFSYESDLLITDLETGVTVEKTLSMNNVYQTAEGYRFYLSSISPSDEASVKHVQVVVNYDPAKYILTYPGGAIVALGIILLFAKHSRYRKRN